MTLEPGSEVPPVTATRQDGERVTVQFQAPTVLFFYPADGTPGCTTEAVAFDDLLGEFTDAGVAVYGVSTDDAASHAAFAEAEGLSVPLLADPDGKVAEAFGVDLSDGRAARTTFVCARGQVCGLYEGVAPEGHAEQVIADVVDIGLVDPPE